MFLFKRILLRAASISPLIFFGLLLATLGTCVLSRMAFADDIAEQVQLQPDPGNGAPPRIGGARLGRDASLVAARLCVAELGWRDREMCTALIYSTGRRAAKLGRTFVTQARAYSAGLRGAQRGRLWPAHLHLETSPPEHWDAQTSAGTTWRGWGLPRFRNVEAHAREVLSGAVPDTCAACVHYGNVGDGPPDGHPEGGGEWTPVCDGLSTPNARGEYQVCWGAPADGENVYAGDVGARMRRALDAQRVARLAGYDPRSDMPPPEASTRERENVIGVP